MREIYKTRRNRPNVKGNLRVILRHRDAVVTSCNPCLIPSRVFRGTKERNHVHVRLGARSPGEDM